MDHRAVFQLNGHSLVIEFHQESSRGLCMSARAVEQSNNCDMPDEFHFAKKERTEDAWKVDCAVGERVAGGACGLQASNDKHDDTIALSARRNQTQPKLSCLGFRRSFYAITWGLYPRLEFGVARSAALIVPCVLPATFPTSTPPPSRCPRRSLLFRSRFGHVVLEGQDCRPPSSCYSRRAT